MSAENKTEAEAYAAEAAALLAERQAMDVKLMAEESLRTAKNRPQAVERAGKANAAYAAARNALGLSEDFLRRVPDLPKVVIRGAGAKDRRPVVGILYDDLMAWLRAQRQP